MLPLEVMGPGWQPLNVAVATPHWQDANRRVSWQAAMATVAYTRLQKKVPPVKKSPIL
jgi:hypothetical protein